MNVGAGSWVTVHGQETAERFGAVGDATKAGAGRVGRRPAPAGSAPPRPSSRTLMWSRPERHSTTTPIAVGPACSTATITSEGPVRPLLLIAAGILLIGQGWLVIAARMSADPQTSNQPTEAVATHR